MSHPTTAPNPLRRRLIALALALGTAGSLLVTAPAADALGCTPTVGLAAPAGRQRVAQAAEPQPYCQQVYESERTQRGTVYRTATDHQGNQVDLALDVWEPIGDPVDERRPVLLWMHGGFFAFGSREDQQWLQRDFAERGFVVVSISYRLQPLAPGSAVPSEDAVQDALEDAAAAVAWLHANADALRIDPTAIVASGYSAGAITALGLAHKPTAVRGPGSATPIAAAVALSGLDLYGPPAAAGDVPVLMFNSADDPVVPQAAARVGCERTALAGSECDFVDLGNSGHTPGSDETVAQTVAWLAAHGLEQLAACEPFDVPDPSSEPTTTTTGLSPTTTTTATTATTAGGGGVGGTDTAPGATPIRARPTYTG